MCLSTILQKGHSLPAGEDAEKVAQGVEHFTQCLATFMNKDGGPYDWQEELDAMTAKWNKLVLGHKDTVPGSSMNFKDLRDKLPEFLNDEVLPKIIVNVEDEVPAQKQQEEEPASQEDEVSPEACELGAAFDDAFGSDSDDDVPPPKKEEPVQAEAKPAKDEEEKQEADGEAAAGDNEKAETAPADGEGQQDGEGRGRGARGRGKNWRRRGRGDGDGDGGHRGRGDRRPRTARPANEDDEGFEVVGKRDDRGRGRNRGKRGNWRGDRGGDRGDGSGRGGRGERRGGFRGRGDKAPTQNGHADLPGVATATAPATTE